MAPLPDISKFATFQELKSASASVEQKCIWYLTDKKRRCRQRLNELDRKDAFKLRAAILGSTPDEISLEQLKQYARLKCCNYGHRSEFTESDLVEPLARRWQEELSTELYLQHTEVLPSRPASSRPRTHYEQDPYIEGPSRINHTSLRSYQGTQVETTAAQGGSLDTVLPTFRPFKQSGTRSVSSQLNKPFDSRETGSIYVYTRASSPGYVKIGYSANIPKRLKEWQIRCDYEPNLIAAFDNVPYMRKTESLIHHQLADSWRAEQRCRKCTREHTEWFEIDTDEAVKVAGQWAEWMKKAEPYYATGNLKGVWVDELERLKNSGILVTAEVLLSSHARLFGTRSTTVGRMEDNANATTTRSILAAEDSTTESEIHPHRVQDLANFMVGTLKIMHDFGRSLQSAGQVLMAADAYQRAATDQTRHMQSAPTRLARQDTRATIASEA